MLAYPSRSFMICLLEKKTPQNIILKEYFVTNKKELKYFTSQIIPNVLFPTGIWIRGGGVGGREKRRIKLE